MVGRTQLRQVGVPRGTIDTWVQSGRVRPIHAGVYALGHTAITEGGRLLAAVLACGPGAVLSHRSAGALWKLREWRSPIVEVTVPRESAPRPRRTIVHRTRHLPDTHVTTLDGLPVTTVARTLLDLAEVLERRALERTLDEAQYLRLLNLTSLDEAVGSAPGRRGAARLKEALKAHRPGTTRTRSELEEAFLALCDHHGLPRPEVNPTHESYLVDFRWPEAKLIVETDGRAAHHTPRAFERDHEREVELALSDDRVLRFTYRQVTRKREWVAEKVREGLGTYSRSRRSNAGSGSVGRSKKAGLRQSNGSPKPS